LSAKSRPTMCLHMLVGEDKERRKLPDSWNLEPLLVTAGRGFCFVPEYAAPTPNWEPCKMSYVKCLACKECGAEYPIEPRTVCDVDFGPVEVKYDYERMAGKVTRESIEA